MKYSEYQANEDGAYQARQAGAAVRILIYRTDNPAVAVVGHTTGINWKDSFEQLPVEEAGEDGVNEVVTGRHSGSATVNGFFTPELNDKLPQRDDFLGNGQGVEYTIMEVVGEGRIGLDLPLNVATGCKISEYGSAHGARGLKTFDLAFTYENRQNGRTWAELTGNA